MIILVATAEAIAIVEPQRGTVRLVDLPFRMRPAAITWDVAIGARAWCATRDAGVLCSDDEGVTWQPSGLEGAHVTAITSSVAEPGVVWAGTEPSGVWRTEDAGRRWRPAGELEALPSSADWSFPPRPDTHHVRWIACHPARPGRLWVAIEAGALIQTDNGGRTWRDRVDGGPFDTHELAIHPDRPDSLRVSAGDGYFESDDGGATWTSPDEGLEVGYLRSVAIDPSDPGTVVVSAASHPHSAYVAGRSDGRLFRRTEGGSWRRVTSGWPDPPDTIAPLLAAGVAPGEIWAADERGVHRSTDGGSTWTSVAMFPATPNHLRGLAVRQ